MPSQDALTVCFWERFSDGLGRSADLKCRQHLPFISKEKHLGPSKASVQRTEGDRLRMGLQQRPKSGLGGRSLWPYGGHPRWAVKSRNTVLAWINASLSRAHIKFLNILVLSHVLRMEMFECLPFPGCRKGKRKSNMNLLLGVQGWYKQQRVNAKWRKRSHICCIPLYQGLS